jgi:chaperonin cofactor prefoldin
MFDIELLAIKEELEKEKANWPKVPPIQKQASELQRKIQNLKRALYNGDLSVTEAMGALSDVSKAFQQLQPICGELSSLVQRRPILRRSTQILSHALNELSELNEGLRCYIDLQTHLEGIYKWDQAKSKSERQAMNAQIKGQIEALIAEGCRASAEEDLALAKASKRIALEALSYEL